MTVIQSEPIYFVSPNSTKERKFAGGFGERNLGKIFG